MSDTPRTDAWKRVNDPIEDLHIFARQLERELNAANQIAKKYEDRYFECLDRIKRLEEALGCVVVSCNYLHHRKKHQHRSGEPCPVEELIRKAKEAKP